MIVLSWNCWGLGNPSVVPNLKYLIRRYKPDVLFMFETISYSNKVEVLRYSLGFDCCFSVNRIGRSGGMAVFWKEHKKCSVQNYSNNHIDMLVEDSIHGNWRLTSFYGFPENSRRRDSWNLIRNLSDSSNLPWCIIGDFNDILSCNEKKGSIERPNWLISGFRQAVQDAGLIDIPLEGYPFTWFKSLGTARAVEERLDRAMTNTNWSTLFPNANLECLTAAYSDHYPILLSCFNDTVHQNVRKSFKFENAWLTEPGFKDFLREKWLNCEHDEITKKIEVC
ncbi:uncharacterized protein LOC131631328 [Vicia villosa]|uniref:uncharacterized protein LOC131631328 n=1 Tax=Vicia villosa TaxID=3911 RepID=UPI00273CCA2C|nr:uncharacterized protein LOC131631328 [Vicia villosa]